VYILNFNDLNHPTMHLHTRIACIALPVFMSCGGEQGPKMRGAIKLPAVHSLPAHAAVLDPAVINEVLVYRTCALYVAIRSGAFTHAASFDTDLEEVTIHWNMCSEGNMVACAKVPTAAGDSVNVGIPWPHGEAGRF
jgi:hypothetical protein